MCFQSSFKRDNISSELSTRARSRQDLIILAPFSVSAPPLGSICPSICVQLHSSLFRKSPRPCPYLRRYLASSCFLTTIYDVMKRIRCRIFSFGLPLSPSLSVLPPRFSVLVLIRFFGQSLPVSSYLRHLFRPPFSSLSTSRTFPERNELIQTWRFRRVSFTVLPSSASFDYDSSAFHNFRSGSTFVRAVC